MEEPLEPLRSSRNGSMRPRLTHSPNPGHGRQGSVNRNTATSVVFIDVFAFPIRNITMILKRRAKATCEAIPSARAIAHLVCGELSDCDPPSTKRQTPCASASRISEATLISHPRISRPSATIALVSARSAM